MTEQECLKAINEDGADALDLLLEADPKFYRRFNSVSNSIRQLLKDVRVHFPDACYYTASGGFNLLLGNPHSDGRGDRAQQELIACTGAGVEISDGDF